MTAIEYTVVHSSENYIKFKISNQEELIRERLSTAGSITILLGDVDCFLEFASVASPQVPRGTVQRIIMYLRGYDTRHDEITIEVTREVFRRLLTGTRKLINKIYGVNYNTIIQDGDKYIFSV